MSEHQHIEPKPPSPDTERKLVVIVPSPASIYLDGKKLSEALLPHIKKYLEEKRDESGGDA